MQGRMLLVFSSDHLPGSSRRKASDAPPPTLAPHQCGHDKRPHGQQKETHQFDDRWDEALVATTTAPLYMNAAPETATINPAQRG